MAAIVFLVRPSAIAMRRMRKSVFGAALRVMVAGVGLARRRNTSTDMERAAFGAVFPDAEAAAYSVRQRFTNIKFLRKGLNLAK